MTTNKTWTIKDKREAFKLIKIQSIKDGIQSTMVTFPDAGLAPLGYRAELDIVTIIGKLFKAPCIEIVDKGNFKYWLKVELSGDSTYPYMYIPTDKDNVTQYLRDNGHITKDTQVEETVMLHNLAQNQSLEIVDTWYGEASQLYIDNGGIYNAWVGLRIAIREYIKEILIDQYDEDMLVI